MYFDKVFGFLDADALRQDTGLVPQMSRRQFGSLAAVAAVAALFEPNASFAAEAFDRRQGVRSATGRNSRANFADDRRAPATTSALSTHR